MTPIRALSVRQPWAELILRGLKTIENRSWNTHMRSRIVLHTGGKVEREAYRELLNRGYSLPPLRDLPRSAYLGTIEITGTHPAGTGCDDQECIEWGHPEVWHWTIATPVRFTEPVPGPGRLNLFEPLVDIGDAV